MLQGKPEALAGVVHSLKTNFGLRFVYVWHGLSAYWSGVSTHDEPVAKYNPRIVYAEPTAGLAEIEPSMRWNPAVISGIGVPESAEQLYADMHSYLASSGGSAGRAEHYLVTVRSGAVLDSARRHAPERLSAGYQTTAQPCSISWSFNEIGGLLKRDLRPIKEELRHARSPQLPVHEPSSCPQQATALQRLCPRYGLLGVSHVRSNVICRHYRSEGRLPGWRRPVRQCARRRLPRGKAVP